MYEYSVSFIMDLLLGCEIHLLFKDAVHYFENIFMYLTPMSHREKYFFYTVILLKN